MAERVYGALGFRDLGRILEYVKIGGMPVRDPGPLKHECLGDAEQDLDLRAVAPGGSAQDPSFCKALSAAQRGASQARPPRLCLAGDVAEVPAARP